MKRYLLTYRTAAILALGIASLLHLFFVLIFIFGRDAMMTDEAHGRPDHLFDVGKVVGSFVSTFIFSFLLYAINFRILRADIKRHRISVIVLATVISTIVISCLLTNIQFLLIDADLGEYYARAVFGGFVRDSLLSLIVVFTSQILYLSYKKQQIALENEILVAENLKSRYERLKSQVDPHFLFNTLNTLNTMIKIDPDKAQEYVQKLSSVFRYTLQNKEDITLEEELKFTGDYCLLMQIRYGDSLSFEFNVAKEYDHYCIIPLSIQVLVENAIKHNIISRKQPLTVTIATTENDTIIVSNPLQAKKEPEPGEGIGLANLTERYRLKFQKEVEVTCNDAVFQVTLPLIKPQ